MAKSSSLRKSIYIIILLFIILMLAILFGAFRTSSIGPDLDKPLTSEEVAKLLPRGQELATAGDCFGCHSLPEGPLAAGGVLSEPLLVPFIPQISRLISNLVSVTIPVLISIVL